MLAGADEYGLATQPLLPADAWDAPPSWFPDSYNHSTLLEVYETRVGLGKVYLTSMYWALTMVTLAPCPRPRPMNPMPLPTRCSRNAVPLPTAHTNVPRPVCLPALLPVDR